MNPFQALNSDEASYKGVLANKNDVGDVEPEDLVEIINHNLAEAVFRCSFAGKILYVNDAFMRLFHAANKQEVIGKPTHIFYQDKSKPKEVSRFLKKLDSVFQGDMEFLTLKGKLFHGHLSTRSVKRGDRVFIDGVIRDRTQEVAAEIAMKMQLDIQEILLKVSSNFLNTDLEQIDLAIHDSLKRVGLYFTVDRMQVHDYNFRRGLCISSYQWLRSRKGKLESEHPPVPISLLAGMVTKHEQGEHIFLGSVAELPDGDIKDYLMAEGIKSSLTIPMIFNNTCVGFISLDSIRAEAHMYSPSTIAFLKLYANMVANIAARSRNDTMMKQLIEKVTRQAKRHKDFSFITSHNIRASSANLQAIAQLLAEDYRGKYLRMLTSTISRLNESVTNINHILNLENDALLRKTRCDVKEVVSRVLKEELADRFEDVNFRMINQLRSNAFIYALPGYIENVLMQIVSNALKYGLNETSNLIEIALRAEKPFLILEVRDYGNGFDFDLHANQVFKVGARFHKNIFDGHGLGLYIVKQQMESLGGDVEIFSKVSEGTVVTLRFPLG